MSKKKLLFFFSLLLILFSSSFISYSQGLLGSDDRLELSVISPYGDIVLNAEKGTKCTTPCHESADKTTEVILDLTAQRDNFLFNDAREGVGDYCADGGGQYTLGVYLGVGLSSITQGNSIQSQLSKDLNSQGSPTGGGYWAIHKLYYCNTQKDLLKKIKVPNNWNENHEVLVYCAESGISDYSTTFSSNPFLFNKIGENSKVYNSCIVKNLELNQSVIYGFVYGNEDLEKEEFSFIDVELGIFPDFLSEENDIEFESQTGNKYYFSHRRQNQNYTLELFNSDENPYFALSLGEFSKSKDLINNFLDINQIRDDRSRIILVRSLNSNQKIYGYQSPEKMFRVEEGLSAFSSELDSNYESNEPAYSLFYDGFENMNSYCEERLSIYEASSPASILSSARVVCNNNDLILFSRGINSKANNLFNENSNNFAFSLFKNMVLDISEIEDGPNFNSNMDSNYLKTTWANYMGWKTPRGSNPSSSTSTSSSIIIPTIDCEANPYICDSSYWGPWY